MNRSPRDRVAIVGMGAVGACAAYVLINSGHGREVLLVDKDIRRAEGQLMDLQHCLPWGRPLHLRACPIEECEDCRFIIVAAGAAQSPGETRLDLLARNASIVGEVMSAAARRNPAATFIIITNPVDVMTRVAAKVSGLPPERVVGTGTTLDSARFRWLLSHHLDVDPRNVHAYVIGEHGDSEVVVWSRAAIGPYSLDEYCAVVNRPLDAARREEITREVRTAAYQIIERKGATSFAIGVSTLRVCESIARDQRTLQTVSRSAAGAYGLHDVAFSLPCLLSSSGAAAPHEIPLDDPERAALMRSAEILDAAYARLGL